jgi:formamidopyrimidine-DNA glycosylase
MPELAEVELSRHVWDVGRAENITRVTLHPHNRIFRGLNPDALARALTGRRLQRSIARGKQLAFVFAKPGTKAPAHWLGIHLGMAGSLHREPAGSFHPGKHDHLVLWGRRHALVFRDVRHFGRVLSHAGTNEPSWWSAMAPDLTSPAFTLAALVGFLQRRKKAPLKAVLLMQERFPGVGNWLADEILWCARLHPAKRGGDISEKQQRTLWREIRRVCRETIRQIDENWNYPKSWLFQHRWRPGGKCPRCRTTLARDTIGGRTTCWCPHCQPVEKASRRRQIKR